MLTTQSGSILAVLEKSDAFYYVRTDMEGRYTFVNDAFQKKFSHISKSFIGEHFGRSVYLDDVDKCNQAANYCIAKPGEVRRISMRKPAQDNEFFWTDWEFCAYTNDDGEPEGLHCIGYDVTGLVRKQKEMMMYTEQLEMAKKLSEIKTESLIKANNELDKFVYRISHDLRSPISTSLGLIELSLMESDEKAKSHYMSLQKKSLEDLDRFIIDILDYSLSSRRETRVEEIALENLIGDICLPYLNKSTDVQLEVKVEQNAPMLSDKMRISMIFNNLISNAFKYSYPHKNKSWVKVEVQSNQQWTKLSVSDNGIGIDEKLLPKIFDMFFRANDKQAGSGLGLYVVKEAVLMLGGNIHANSSKGEGTIVVVEIPNLLAQT